MKKKNLWKCAGFGINNHVCQISLLHVAQEIIQSKIGIHLTMIFKRALFDSYHTSPTQYRSTHIT